MKRLLIFGIFAVLSACKGQQSELPVFDLEAGVNSGGRLVNDFTLNEIVDVIDVIPIETPPDVPMGLTKLTYIGKEHFYVLHDDKFSRIDRDGKIVSTISRRGRGQGEYLSLSVIDVNESASTIRVFDWRSDKYITYDIDGNLINENSLSGKEMTEPRRIGSDYMITASRGKDLHRVFITDRDMNIKYRLFPMDPDLSEIDREELARQVTSGKDGDDVLLNFGKEDTLYHVDKHGSVVREAILYKGKYRLPRKPIMVVFDDMKTQYIHNTLVNAFGDYYFIDLYIFGLVKGIWSKADGRLLASSDSREVGFDNVGFPIILPSGKKVVVSNYYVEGDTMAFLVDASDINDDTNGIEDDDNPVIVVTRLKKT